MFSLGRKVFTVGRRVFILGGKVLTLGSTVVILGGKVFTLGSKVFIIGGWVVTPGSNRLPFSILRAHVSINRRRGSSFLNVAVKVLKGRFVVLAGSVFIPGLRTKVSIMGG